MVTDQPEVLLLCLCLRILKAGAEHQVERWLKHCTEARISFGSIPGFQAPSSALLPSGQGSTELQRETPVKTHECSKMMRKIVQSSSKCASSCRVSCAGLSVVNHTDLCQPVQANKAHTRSL